jgi:hypothetical protein
MNGNIFRFDHTKHLRDDRFERGNEKSCSPAAPKITVVAHLALPEGNTA